MASEKDSPNLAHLAGLLGAWAHFGTRRSFARFHETSKLAKDAILSFPDQRNVDFLENDPTRCRFRIGADLRERVESNWSSGE